MRLLVIHFLKLLINFVYEAEDISDPLQYNYHTADRGFNIGPQSSRFFLRRYCAQSNKSRYCTIRSVLNKLVTTMYAIGERYVYVLMHTKPLRKRTTLSTRPCGVLISDSDSRHLSYAPSLRVLVQVIEKKDVRP